MQAKSIALLQKVDSSIEQILQKFQDVFEAGHNEGKSKELLSVESLSMDSDAVTIIRLCEELLSTTRYLRETWCLGTLKVNKAGEGQQDVELIHQKFNEVTDRIAEYETKHGELAAAAVEQQVEKTE